MADVVFEYPDGRTGQTTEAGFDVNHKPFNAKIIAYVGADGRSYPVNAEGKRGADAAKPTNWSALNEEVAERQQRAAEAEEKAAAKETKETKETKG